jgi:NTP pyrophosphatase (non-canonical NTP hydrolase)
MAMTAKGLAKLIEELGELQQVVGKRLAYYTTDEHPDGAGSLQGRMADEMADVTAAMAFVSQQFGIDTERVKHRAARKLALFQQWHSESGNNSHAVDAHRAIQEPTP